MFPHKKVILITGANGQLGQEFRYLAKLQDKYEFLFTSKETLDVTNAAEVIHIFQKFKPDYCINCVAYTSVDRAEQEPEKAYSLNSTAVHNLVNACGIYKCALIHFSTDYVYDSVLERPILESDDCNPQSVYAKSKRAGELILEQSTINWICLRISWLYSTFNTNFVKTMLRLGSEKDSLKVVNDQTGSPTYARNLANDLIKILDTEKLADNNGFYNYSNEGITTWADFAREIFRIKQINCNVIGIPAHEYRALAPRPNWSVLSKQKIMADFKLNLTDWKKALTECLADIKTT